MSTVTVVTASTGRPSLAKCIQSVANQKVADGVKIQHLIFADGPECNSKVKNIAYAASIKFIHADVIQLPQSVGKDRWNGHRMYAAGSFLAAGDHVMFLDDDNTIDPTHIQDCLAAVAVNNAPWAYSLRKIVDAQGNFLCNDDCESLGRHHTVMNQNDYLVDVNCYFLSKPLAVQLAPIWNRKAREPGVMEVDRALIKVLLQNQVPGAETGQYTVNYAVGGNALSVAPEFFIQGNKKMNEIYKGDFPWRKK